MTQVLVMTHVFVLRVEWIKEDDRLYKDSTSVHATFESALACLQAGEGSPFELSAKEGETWPDTEDFWLYRSTTDESCQAEIELFPILGLPDDHDDDESEEEQHG